jgi:hypothetical protein
MRSTWRGGCVFVLTVLAAGACSSESTSDGSGAATICTDVEQLLNRQNETLQCPSGGEVLADMCRRGLASKPACRREVQALFDCVKDKPLSDWSCHPVGEYPGLSTGACAAQDQAISACFGD